MNIEISDEMAIELADAHIMAGIGQTQRLIDVVGALLVYIPDPRAPQPVDIPVEVKPPAPWSRPKERRRLTPHQREVYDSIFRASRRMNATGDRRWVWVDAENIGSKNACDRLVEKGWVEVDIEYGPRGGEHRRYRPITEEKS